MRPLLESLLDRAGDPADWDRQQEALLQLMLLLERTNRPPPGPPESELAPDLLELEQVIPEPLRREPLGDVEQGEVVAAVKMIVLTLESDDGRIGAVGVLTAAAPWLSIEPLADLLVHHRDRLSPEEVRLVSIGIERALDFLDLPEEQQEAAGASHISLVLRLVDPREVLDELARDANERVAEPARRLRGAVPRAREILTAD